MYDIPDRIFEQYNRAQVSTMMGLFAEINHAWISIDNTLYLWDYTHPNPELIGFEEQPHSITAVKLVYPRPGVFVPAIMRILVVATTHDIFLIGVALVDTPGAGKGVNLYQTRMHVPLKGTNVTCIAGSASNGRIFFGGRGDDDVFEITYQQEEKWFQSRCSKVNHTTQGFTSLLPALPFSQKSPQEFIVQMALDDSRNLLYTLSSRSTIRIFSTKSPTSLDLCITRTMNSTLNDLGHRIGQSSLLAPNTTIVSLNTISAREASRLSLMATTSTGCRILYSAVSSNYFGGDASAPPTSLQVHHVKFPPRNSGEGQQNQQQQQPQQQQQQIQAGIPSQDVSKSLTLSRMSARYPPGYFLCFVQKSDHAQDDVLFISAPDAGRIAHPQDQSQANRFPETGSWLRLESRAEDIGLITAPFSASSNPTGFGNELAVQYDQPVTEIAILTNSGIYTFRRRRLADVFAATVRFGGGDEGLEGEVRNFVRIYGRAETIATAIAVTCGQGMDVTIDSRVAGIADPEVIERARKAFIEHGGKPMLNENSVLEHGASAIDNVRPSPRHEGLALYISRLLRSIWKNMILVMSLSPTGSVQVLPTVSLNKLQDIQRNLTKLEEFLNANKSFIEGLAGPDALGRVSTKQEEVALQGEHRALTSLMALIADVVEGISFVLVLFDEKVDEVILSISEQSRQLARQMTYEKLCCSPEGKDLAKELVKAIVNKNIASGSNVDTVTDALRRRCGSFCSADDCVIFKAQEQLKRASDGSASSEMSRNLLNESLRLLQKVAASLSLEQLQWAVEQYIALEFYAGAIQLVLNVAHENDRGQSALSWMNDGTPANDPRSSSFDTRTRCYDLVHKVISALDQSSDRSPEKMDGIYTTAAKRRREAYDVINDSQDEVFQIHLFDWYLSQGWHERLLDIRSPYVVKYLQRKSQEDVAHADLLWTYYAQNNNFLEAAKVQLQLGKSDFSLTLEQRIGYLSRARANASIRSISAGELSLSRQSRQELIREISDLLDIANIQDDLLQRIRSDVRIPAERKPQVITQLNNRVLSIDEVRFTIASDRQDANIPLQLYNGFADQASYYDICVLIYQVADYRNNADIRATWQNLLESVHQETEQAGSPLPYESVSEKVRSLGMRLNLHETIFPICKAARKTASPFNEANLIQRSFSPCSSATPSNTSEVSARQHGSLTSS